MQCPECTKKNMMVEMNHMASHVVAKNIIEYEEWCPKCGAAWTGVLTREKHLDRFADENYGR